jgi:hypothetical protein
VRAGKAVVSLLLLGPPLMLGVLYILQSGPLAATIAFIFWLFVCIPVATVASLDWFRTPTPQTPARELGHPALRVLFLILGVTACVIGIGVLGWVGYNLAWERLPQFKPPGGLASIGSVVGMILMVRFGAKLIRASFTGKWQGTSAARPLSDTQEEERASS